MADAFQHVRLLYKLALDQEQRAKVHSRTEERGVQDIKHVKLGKKSLLWEEIYISQETGRSF